MLLTTIIISLKSCAQYFSGGKRWSYCIWPHTRVYWTIPHFSQLVSFNWRPTYDGIPTSFIFVFNHIIIFSCSKQFSVPRTDSACLLLLMMIDFVLPFLMLYTYKDWNLYGFSLLKVLNLRCSLTISRFCYIFIIYIFLIINFNIFIKIIIKLIKKKKI